MLLTYLDNFLNDEENQKVYEECLNVPCKWGASDLARVKEYPRLKHWHFWIGPIDENNHNCQSLLQKAIKELNLHDYQIHNFYINCQMIGDESVIHKDRSDITLLYYPVPNWKLDWDGGTVFYNDSLSDSIAYSSYIPKRLVLYNSKIFHKPVCISKYANEPRIVMVIKLDKKV